MPIPETDQQCPKRNKYISRIYSQKLNYILKIVCILNRKVTWIYKHKDKEQS